MWRQWPLLCTPQARPLPLDLSSAIYVEGDTESGGDHESGVPIKSYIVGACQCIADVGRWLSYAAIVDMTNLVELGDANFS